MRLLMANRLRIAKWIMCCGECLFLQVDHTIEFRFEPRSYIMGNKLSIWAALFTYFLLIAAALQVFGVIKPKRLTLLKPNAVTPEDTRSEQVIKDSKF